jgi:serine/threonine-protein kinase
MMTEQDTPPPRISRTITPLPIAAQRFMLELKEGSPVGDYEIQEQIGEGAMGTVYSAIHSIVGKTVAIKVLKPELCTNQLSIDRFVQEAQAVNKIGHPNIVDVFSLDMLPDGRAYMIMEWLHGEDLKVRLGRGPITVADACDILDGIARALDAAHAKDIVHRDLKPDNVFLHRVENGPVMVKLLDFGIAKLVKSQSDMEKTRTGNMLGTPRYISPEQARGVDVTHRSDIYSLGVLAYEMLAGRPPFQGETGMDLVIKHLSEAPPPLSQFTRVPKPLEQCVMHMLSKDPALRPSLEEIRQILSDPTKKLARMALPNGKKFAIAACALLLVVSAAFASLRILGAAEDNDDAPTVVAPMAGSQAKVEPPTPPPVVPAVTPPAAPVEPPKPVVGATVQKTSTVEVSVTGPKSSMILIDGNELGLGPKVKAEIEAGEHDIEVRAPGRKSTVQHVTIEEGQDALVAIVVPMAPPRTITRPPKRQPPPKQTTKPTAPDDDDLMKPKDIVKKGKK